MLGTTLQPLPTWDLRKQIEQKPVKARRTTFPEGMKG